MSAKSLASILNHPERPRVAVIEQYVKLMGGSLQSADELEKVCKALGVDDPDVRKQVTSSDWIAMSKKLQRAAWLVASAAHCLYEWHEPQEDRPDTPDPHRPLGLREIQTPP